MRIKVDFHINESRILRSSATVAMTAYIYRAIAKSSKSYADKMHDEGLVSLSAKIFNCFTYALFQNDKLIKKELNKGKASIIISSSMEDTIIHFTKGMLQIGYIQLFGKSYEITNIEYIKDKPFRDAEMFHIISPVYAEKSGRRWLEKEEMEIHLADLLIGKYFAINNKLPKDIKIKLINTSQENMYYKTDIFRGYRGNIIIEGDKEITKLAYDSGVGSKCGCGLGLIIRR